MDGLKDKLKNTGLGANKRTALIILALILIPMAVGITAREQSRRNNSNANADVLAETQANEIIKKVGALMELPNEEPTVATVSDVSKLSDQQFFAKAQNGDKVIIFPNAQKAILYRPSTDKIIEIALYTPPTVSPEAQVSPGPSSRSLQDLVGSPTPTAVPSVSPSVSPAVTGTTSPTPTP
jgi:hypothetical protein